MDGSKQSIAQIVWGLKFAFSVYLFIKWHWENLFDKKSKEVCGKCIICFMPVHNEFLCEGLVTSAVEYSKEIWIYLASSRTSNAYFDILKLCFLVLQITSSCFVLQFCNFSSISCHMFFYENTRYKCISKPRACFASTSAHMHV